ncbi:MAG: Ribosomal protein L32E [Candidatus Methanohalarchaeum thermophilum]|uniref:Large ribosomal subunit protein eL32 n=1 Tax=Methanohalarchaeum thermophilum TaxID=1903181 RepID=A0A1Q6DX22_METT1|nr:MAG: Ribosomal protein L32E [Candidatus Methanohalarchaeum thermophilum]
MTKKFRRQESQKHKKVKNKWRRPKGLQSNQRKETAGAPPKPKVGRKKPEDKRGLHPSGYEEKLVHNAKNLEEIDTEKEAIKISSKVGQRKRKRIQKKAKELGIKILNPKKIEG